jgi:hypothetical protein
MKITNTCLVLMASGILSFAGCSLLGPESKEEAQFDRTEVSSPQSLAGMYSDLGSDGSIKPHPESTNQMNQESQGRSTGVMILGGPADMPNMRTGNSTIKGRQGGQRLAQNSVQRAQRGHPESDGLL